MVELRTIARELIVCIGEAREPSERELFSMAAQVARDLGPIPSAFAWGAPVDDRATRLVSLLVARAAMTGAP